MKIAVTYENGQVFSILAGRKHLKSIPWRTARCKNQRSLVQTERPRCPGWLFAGTGRGYLIGGGIGGGAQNALAAAGIRLYGGASGKRTGR